MSWLTAVVTSPGELPPSSFNPEPPLHALSFPGFTISVGGNPDTCFFRHNQNGLGGWAVVGTGIRIRGGSASLLSDSDWYALLSGDSFDPSGIDGHFVVVRWRSGHVECFTDQLGLRTLYFEEGKNGMRLSTHLDWLAATGNRREVDFHALGSQWLTFNQLSYVSGVKGIGRLGPGGSIHFDRGASRIHHTVPWAPEFQPEESARAIDIARSLIVCAFRSSHVPSLGLSGGIDSRLLLALLTGVRDSRFLTHTFGDREDPDVRIAGAIASSLGIVNRHFDDPLPGLTACVDAMRTFVARTNLIEPATSFQKLRYYQKLGREGNLLIDGGFGEIARRQYFNRMATLGRSALYGRDITRLLTLIRSARPEIFAPPVMEMLRSGARRSLEETLGHMPAVGEIGVENFADLFAVRTRVPNYGGPEQARLDATVLNFMPLVQPSFLRAVFGMPVRERRNAAFYYEAIRTAQPVLQNFPLVKSGLTYPFGISSVTASMLIKAKSRLSRAHADQGPQRLLAHIRPYVLDLAHSQDVASNPMYSPGAIAKTVTRYYKGETRMQAAVDWWLTFELWTQGFAAATDIRAGGTEILSPLPHAAPRG